MDFAEAWILVGKERALSEQLKRLADGTWATMRLCVWSVGAGEIGFHWQPRIDSYDRKLVFTVPASECLDKTDEEITALVEKHIPGYLDRLERARAERKRRQRIRVQRNNEQISYKRRKWRENAKCHVCDKPIVGAIRRRKFCSAACRQRASRYDL